MDEDQADETTSGGNQFLQPSFVGAAVLVLVIVILGVFIVVRVAITGDGQPATTTSATPVPTATSTGGGDASICGLRQSEGDSDLSMGPAAVWHYEGTTAYPTSQEFGPGRTAPEGYRYCFQRSEAGALFMAANALGQGSNQATSADWARYVLAEGPYRKQLLSEISTPSGSDDGVRARVVGFRVLNFDGATARVDLGVLASSQAQNLSVSAVYELVWEGGDWRISSSVAKPLDTSTVSDFTGFVPWGE